MSGINWREWATTTHGPAELLAASFAFWWGYWIWSPGWEAFGTSATYTVMGQVAPDVIWGGVLMAAGVALGWLSLTRRIHGKQLILLFLMGYFIFVSVVFGFANMGSTAPITYFHVALTYAWLWWTERRRNGW